MNGEAGGMTQEMKPTLTPTHSAADSTQLARLEQLLQEGNALRRQALALQQESISLQREVLRKSEAQLQKAQEVNEKALAVNQGALQIQKRAKVFLLTLMLAAAVLLFYAFFKLF